jgi:hypothetical protein
MRLARNFTELVALPFREEGITLKGLVHFSQHDFLHKGQGLGIDLRAADYKGLFCIGHKGQRRLHAGCGLHARCCPGMVAADDDVAPARQGPADGLIRFATHDDRAAHNCQLGRWWASFMTSLAVSSLSVWSDHTCRHRLAPDIP